MQLTTFFLKDSGQAIPLVVESCIRYINLYGKLNLRAVFPVLSIGSRLFSIRDEIQVFILVDSCYCCP